jgi:hypothetical protein
MPLHVGYGSDKGGNSVDVDFMGKSTNLHHVWDSDVIEYHKTVAQDLTEMCKKLTNAEIKKQQKVDVVTWMNESRDFLPQVYEFKKGEINEEYINKALPVIEKQILNAGLRLSGVLNEIFSLLSSLEIFCIVYKDGFIFLETCSRVLVVSVPEL